jgi:hypothetical protein
MWITTHIQPRMLHRPALFTCCLQDAGSIGDCSLERWFVLYELLKHQAILCQPFLLKFDEYQGGTGLGDDGDDGDDGDGQ